MLSLSKIKTKMIGRLSGKAMAIDYWKHLVLINLSNRMNVLKNIKLQFC